MNEDLNSKLEQAAAITARLVHDFGNTLTGVLGFTELGLSRTPPDGLVHRYLQEALQSAQKGASWVHRLHLFCRRNPVQTWPTAIPSVLAAEGARLRAAGVHELRWTSQLPEDLPLVDIDAGSLHAVLSELVNNAWEASGDSCAISVGAQVRDLNEADCLDLLGAARTGPHVELTIADDGPGISSECYSRLFHELFVSTKPRHRGLGLLVVYGILCRFHGGFRISPPGVQGTTVQLYLPAVALARSAWSDSERVLLVHPDPLLYESMQKVLESSGCRVTVADSPQAGLSAHAAAGSEFSLIVTDLVLPQVSGVDFARRILDRDPKASFVFCNTQPSHGLMEEDLLKRCPVLHWPLAPQAFLRTVRNSLARIVHAG
jgi:CheY-like chemotaxis protein